jgi:hypothetical protein
MIIKKLFAKKSSLMTRTLMTHAFGLLLFSIATTSMTEAHGMDKPGPHGGFIKMPGSFHTELILEEQKAKVWLLDANFENPTIKESSLGLVVFRGKNKVVNVNCVSSEESVQAPSKDSAEAAKTSSSDSNTPKEGLFSCVFPEGFRLHLNDQLVFKAVREKAEGQAEYAYVAPLSKKEWLPVKESEDKGSKSKKRSKKHKRKQNT